MDYAMTHDDGQSMWDLEQADVLILGVSRTSKTPTCIYLANRGIKAANIPIILGHKIPDDVFKLQKPLIIGLVKDSRSLGQVRRNRLRMLMESQETSYADPEKVNEEVNYARKLFTNKNIDTIDVSRRSIEETAAAILQLHSQLLEKRN